MSETLAGNYNGLPQDPGYHNPQVHNLVKDGSGASRSFIDRAYISFSYGGKDIEEFGLIAVFEDNGKTGSVYANFEDITSSYQMVDGQFYWGTHFTNNTLNFTLATDGMTQKQLDAFKRHFRPGQSSAELVLSEHPNRAILARISAPPTYQLMPFKEKEVITISGVQREAPVTVYKGTIQLAFVMDNPFWYALQNHLTGELSDDVLKIIMEDNIPYGNLPAKCFIGGRTYSDADNDTLEWRNLNSILHIVDAYNITDSNDLEGILDTLVGNNEIGISINDNDIIEEDSQAYLCSFSAKKNTTTQIPQVELSLKCYVSRTFSESSEEFSPIPIAYLFVAYKYWFNNDSSNIKYDSHQVDGNDTTYYDYSSQVVNDGSIIFHNGLTWVLNSNHYQDIGFDNIRAIDMEVEIYEKNVAPETTIYRKIGQVSPIHIDFLEDNIQYTITNGPKLFNAGTAPTSPILTFRLYPSINNNTGYICNPWNSYCPTNNTAHNQIKLHNNLNNNDILFNFSLPSAYIGFNQAIQLATEMNGQSKVAVEEAMRNGIKEYYSRAWAIHCVESQQNSNFSFSLFKAEMKKFISDDNNNYYPATFVFNSATGEAIGGIGVRTITSTAAGTIIKENVGDMVKSKYLTIEENNHLVNGQIGTDYYTVTTDYPGGLTNVLILFNNMYY